MVKARQEFPDRCKKKNVANAVDLKSAICVLLIVASNLLHPAKGHCQLAVSATKHQCRDILKSAKKYAEEKQYENSLKKLAAYKICDPDNTKIADSLIVFIYKSINGERLKAIEMERLAKKQTSQAQIAERLAARRASELSAQKLVLDSQNIELKKKLGLQFLENARRAYMQKSYSEAIYSANAAYDINADASCAKLILEINSDSNAIFYKQRFSSVNMFDNVVAQDPTTNDFLIYKNTDSIELMSLNDATVKKLPFLIKNIIRLSFSPNRKRLAGMDKQGNIKIWNYPDLSEMITFQLPNAKNDYWHYSGRLVLSDNGNIIVSKNDSLYIYADRGTMIAAKAYNHYSISAILLAQAENLFYTVHPGRVIAHDLQGTIIPAKSFKTIENGGTISALSRSGEYIAVASYQGDSVVIFNTKMSLQPSWKSKLDGVIEKINISHDGKSVLVAMKGGDAYLIKHNDPRHLLIPKDSDRNTSITDMFFYDDNSVVIFYYFSIVHWNLPNKYCHILPGQTKPIVMATCSRDGETILTGNQDTDVILWSKNGTPVDTFSFGKYISQLNLNLSQAIEAGTIGSGLTNSVTRLCFTPDSNYIITEYFKKILLVWDRRLKKVVKTVDVELNTGNGSPYYSESIQFDRSGRYALFQATDNSVVILDMTDMNVRRFEYKDEKITGLSYSASHSFIDIGHFNKVTRYNLNVNLVSSCSLSVPVSKFIPISNNEILVSGSDGTISLVDMGTGTVQKSTTTHRASGKIIWLAAAQQLYCLNEGWEVEVVNLKEFSSKKLENAGSIKDIIEYDASSIILKTDNGAEIYNPIEKTKNLFPILTGTFDIIAYPKNGLLIVNTADSYSSNITVLDKNCRPLLQFENSMFPGGYGELLPASGEYLFAIGKEKSANTGGETGKIFFLERFNQGNR